MNEGFLKQYLSDIEILYKLLSEDNKLIILNNIVSIQEKCLKLKDGGYY